ncbi:MAG: sulfate respiration complex hexadecaheme cytochrome HmcA [Thermodesulfobacteriota bacterium]
MNKKLLGFIVLIGISTCFFFLLLVMGNIWAERGDKEKSSAPPILISETAVFKELERPPVEFYHDGHTVALEKEGCGVCHPQDEKGGFTFKYPKLRDDSTKQGLMNSYHDSCIGCHVETSKKGKKSGFVTCGECHVVKKKSRVMKYAPIGPDYYYSLNDTYHKDCIACHKEGREVTKEAEVLSWKEFYIKKKEIEKTTWSKIGFDYYLHNQHEKGLEKDCKLCHHIYDEKEKKLVYKKGTESSCRDCHREKDEENRRSYKNVAHEDCINCHMKLSKESKKTGPYVCEGCHIEKKQQTTKEAVVIPRLERGQPDRILISIKGSRMKGVPFDHKSHETQSLTCRNCHHEKLIACKECHTINGSPEGGMVNLAKAYHEPLSERSCIGCHTSYKSKPSCAGCHHLLESGLTEASCLPCHNGSFKEVGVASKLGNPNKLLPANLSGDITIKTMERDYMPAKFPHLRIIKKLTEISNSSNLAKKFHNDQKTICSACHHKSPLEAKKEVPLCSTCHSVNMEPKKTDTPGLLGAYHRLCLGCHKEMRIEPMNCTGCHAEKTGLKTGISKQ